LNIISLSLSSSVAVYGLCLCLFDDVGLLLVEVFFFRACDEISEEKDQKKKIELL